DLLQQYKRLERDASGTRHIKYKFGACTKDGRLYAQGPSLQNFPGGVRDFIAAGVLCDMDGENMHPRIILALCELHGIDAPYLREYVEHRERVLSEIAAADNCGRGGAKDAVLIASYGGDVR
ncbi:hypothetical protein JKP88DRAFT_131019, partial [Tribonema minus]